MEFRTKNELEQHLSDIHRLASNAVLASEDKDAAVRAERFAIGLLKEHDASGHGGKRCPFATRLRMSHEELTPLVKWDVHDCAA